MSRFAFSLPFFIGSRFGKSRKKSGFVSFITLSSIIGIAIGVIALTVGLSAMNGFERELEERVLSVIPHGDVHTAYGRMNDYRSYGERMTEDPHILAYAPYVNVNALLDRKNEFKAMLIKGIVPEMETKVVSVGKFVADNALDTLVPGSGNIIIGSSIAEKYQIKKGDELHFMVSVNASARKLSAPKVFTFKVSGFFHMSGQLDGMVSYIHMADAQKIFNLSDDQVDGISFKTDNFLASNQIIVKKAKELRQMVYVGSWMQTQGHLYSDIQLVRLVIYISLFIVICVACFNIVSSLMMILNDKKSSIAILVSMGARNKLIRHIFVTIGFINGSIGVAIGLAAGFILSWNLNAVFALIEKIMGRTILDKDLYFIDFIPSEVHLIDFLIVGAGALFICFISTLYPAFRTSGILPAVELSKGK